jgi:hypothetical protein
MLFRFGALHAGVGSFDFVRLTPHYAQDDRGQKNEWGLVQH